MTFKAGDPISFRYTRTPAYRTVHADGCWGSVTAPGNIFMSVFTEHLTIPDEVTFTISESGTLQPGSETPVGKIAAVEREFEVGIVMSPDVAESMISWLQQQLVAARALANAKGARKEK